MTMSDTAVVGIGNAKLKRACPSALNQRAVLLGASNLTRGFTPAIHVLRRLLPGPLDILAALGHGRSFGLPSTVLARQLPGIDECGLWLDLVRRPKLPTVALITDIGNDLLYGYPVKKICEWVERCIDRLQHAGAQISVSELPIANLPNVRQWQYFVLRTLMFPTSRLSYAEAYRRAYELNSRLERLCESRGVQLVRQQGQWYGLDPIHFRGRLRETVWQQYIAPVARGPAPENVGPTRGVRTLTIVPQRRRVLGVEQCRKQPSRQLADGTLISVY